MAATELSGMVIGLGANTATLKSDFDNAKSITSSAVADINVMINKIGSGANFNGVSSQIRGLTDQFASLKNLVAGGLTIAIGGSGLKEISDIADSWQLVSNRIQTTTSNSTQLVAVQNELFKIAQQTNNAIDDTAKTYQRIEQAIEATGKTQVEAQQQAVAITKTLNQEIIVSGASAGEASRSIMDLVHGLSGGEIQARQFNQVIRQMPDLAKQIADGMGVTVKQLEEMVHKGVPAQSVLSALANQAGVIDAKFNALPRTFAQSWTVLSNAVEKYIGEAARGSTISEILKASIIGAANNIQALAIGAEAVGAAMGLWLGGKGLTAIGNIAVSLKEATFAQGAYKTAAILSAEADMQAAASAQAAIAATAKKITALETLKLAQLDELQASKAALTAEIEMNATIAAQIEAQGSRAVGAYEAMAAAKLAVAAVDAKIVVAEDALTVVEGRAAAASAAEAAATAKLTEAKAALATSQAAATSATGLFSRAGSALFAAIGGWTTVVLALVAGLAYLYTSQSDLQKQSDSLTKVIDDVARAHGNLNPQIDKTVESAYNEAKAMQEAAAQQLAHKEAQMQALATSQAQPAAIAAISDSMNRMSRDLDIATQKVNDLAFAFLKAKLQSAGKSLYEAMFPDVRSALSAIDALTDGIDKQDAKFREMAATYGKGHEAQVQYIKDEQLKKLSVGQSTEAIELIKKALDEKYAADLRDAAALDRVTAATKEHRKELTAQEQALKSYNTDIGKLSDIEAQLSSGLGGPYLEALKKYQHGMDLTNKTWKDAVAAKTADDELSKRITADQENLGKQLAITNQQIKEQHDAIDPLNREFSDLLQVYSVATEKQAALSDGLKQYADRLKSHYDFYGNYIEDEKKLKQALDDQLPSYVAAKQKVDDLQRAQQLNMEAAKQWQGIWANVGDGVASTFAKVLVEGGSLMDGLKNLAKQTVEAIIEYFAKLAVINPILNSIFGGGVGMGSGFQLLPTLANTAFGGGGFGGGTGAAGGAGGGGMISGLFSPDTWLNAGKSIYQGFTGLFGSGGGAAVTGAGQLGDFTGPGTQFLNYGGEVNVTEGATAGIDQSFGAAANYGNVGGGIGYGGYGSALGQGLGIVGGVAAGIGEYKNAGGGVAGVAGGLAYGYGTYTAGAAASAFLAGGTAALGAIPVVGWIALAAMLIDKFSGGKLFGTSGKVVGGNQTETISDSGANVLTNITKKGQRALFGGAYWKETPVATDPATIKAAQDFQATLKKSTDDFAKFFGTDLVKIVGGSFQTMFDKNGKQTGTASTVDGVSFKGETAQQWAERLQAGSYLKVLDQMGLAASKFVEGLQGNADDLLKGVQDFAGAAQAAFTNIGKGFQFLALGANETLPQVMKFVEGLQQAGESLSETYSRLAQAQAQYDQFVGQFKPAPTYADAFQASMANLYTQMIAAQHQANALAQAAGASGAATDDLINIQKSYAKQAAAMVFQLEANAQSLAFSLGLTTLGSLDQINAEIQALQGNSSSASSTISDFGSAIQTVATKANDAINLLLGDLSPLNDQQKLQTALQGLRAGTVTQEAVLTIGRRLYASSQAYNDLFAQVSQYPSGGQTGGGGYTGGGVSSTTGRTLSSAEQAKLDELIKERDALQAAQTRSQYQTLAQEIADIASAKGEDWQAVLNEMQVKAADLETGLGLKDDAALDTYIKNMQAQTDSAQNDTKSIVDAIFKLDADLLGVLGNGSPVTGEPTIGADPTNRIGTPSPIDRINGGSGALVPRAAPGTVGRNTEAVPVTLSQDDIDALSDRIGAKISGSFKATVREHADTFMRSGR